MDTFENLTNAVLSSCPRKIHIKFVLNFKSFFDVFKPSVYFVLSIPYLVQPVHFTEVKNKGAFVYQEFLEVMVKLRIKL